MQTLIVVLLVAVCSVYAAWTLMPAAARRGLATAMLKLPLPASFAQRLRQSATAASGCGCDGCDSAPLKPKSPAAGQVVNFHPRPKR